MSEFDSSLHPHRRFNPLNGQWVLVSPHRGLRPWLGQDDPLQEEATATYAEECYLCPGNTRASGVVNESYEACFVFDNDFAALEKDTPIAASHENDLLHYESVRGMSRVICFSPDHSKTLPQLSVEDVCNVLKVYAAQIEQLGKEFVWVQIFENKGAAMGCSQPHPHAQVWAANYLPNELKVKENRLRAHFERTGANLLLEYAQREVMERSRLVVETDSWVAVVPYWAAWPFETMILPTFAISRFDQLTNAQQTDLAAVLHTLTIKYDNLFKTSFPYSMGWHYAPLQRAPSGSLVDAPHWQLHAVFYPPLLRSASVRKYMVGFELLAETQRDLTAEQAAERLRAQSNVHYLDAA